MLTVPITAGHSEDRLPVHMEPTSSIAIRAGLRYDTMWIGNDVPGAGV